MRLLSTGGDGRDPMGGEQPAVFAAFPVFAAWHHLRLTSYPISKTLNKNRNLTFHGLA